MIEKIIETFKPTWVWIEAKQPLTSEELKRLGVSSIPKWSKRDVLYVATCDIEKK